MFDSSPDERQVEDLAEEFLERRRRGERPTLEEYAARYPRVADEIREFFPVLGLVEDFKPGAGDITGSLTGAAVAGIGTLVDRLGEFHLLREVGRGGMGVVYEAIQESLGRRVALKVLRMHRLLDPMTLVRFHREAKAAARLHHNNIVPVFGVGEYEGVHFYVMQFIRGLPLDAVLKEVRRLNGKGVERAGSAASTRASGPFTEADLVQSLVTGRFARAVLDETGSAPGSDRAASAGGDSSSSPFPNQPGLSSATDPATQYARSVARLGLQVADALDYAHQHRILHRDIKPSNLLLDAHGTVWVTDFGLAKIASDSDLTRTGDIVGTVRYMAPERFEGHCDVRADIYALGLTLYELLARRPAFEAEGRAALIRQVTQEEPRELRRIDRSIPRDLETIVRTAVAKDPKHRYATAALLRDELERFLADRPIRSRPVSPPERYWRWCRRNPPLALASTAAFVFMIAVAVISTVAAVRNGRLAGELKTQRDQANLNLIHAYTNEAEARRHSRRVGQRFEALEAVAQAMRLVPAVGLTEPERFRLRTQAIAAMGLPDMRVGWHADIADPGNQGFTVDPSFERYAIKREDGTIVIRRLADNQTLLQLEGLPFRSNGAVGGFSPDGRYLAMKSWNGHDSLEIWDLNSRRAVLTEGNFSGNLTPTWAFHPDGRQLAFGRLDGTIVVVDLVDGHELRRWSDGFGRVTAMAFNHDGSRLAFASWQSNVIGVLANDRAHVGRPIELHSPAQVFHIAWNPRDTNLLAAGAEDNTIRIWDVNTGRQTVSLTGENYNGIVVAFHPGGDLLASRGWNGMLRLWDTRTERPILSMPSQWLPELRFDRDGRRLSAHSLGDAVGILEVAYETDCRSLVRDSRPLSSDIKSVAVDQTGRYLGTASTKGITIWDLPSGTPLALLPRTVGETRIQFDPAGAILTSYPLTLRWPISSDGSRTQIGPPQLLQWYHTRGGFSRSGDGRVVALALYNGGGLVFDPERPNVSRLFLPHRDARGIAVSPDGQRVATGSHDSGTIKIWNAATGRLLYASPDAPRHGAACLFSPDGRWLAVAVQGTGWELLETTSWSTKIRLGNSMSVISFSPDSAIVAIEHDFESRAGSVTLVESSSGRELAQIDDPDGARAAEIVFSPDGTQMIATLLDQPLVRIWDLRSVRRRLAELGLDWSPGASWSSTTPAVPHAANFTARPSPLHVDRGQLDLWLKIAPIKQREQAVADALALYNSDPGQGEVCAWLAETSNTLAWELIAGSLADREPARALPLARRAVALAPENEYYLNTLGVALCRNGRHAEAVPILERSLAAANNLTTPSDLFCLVVCHAKQGNEQRARAYFERALKWVGANSERSEELKAFRGEAEAAVHAIGEKP